MKNKTVIPPVLNELPKKVQMGAPKMESIPDERKKGLTREAREEDRRNRENACADEFRKIVAKLQDDYDCKMEVTCLVSNQGIIHSATVFKSR